MPTIVEIEGGVARIVDRTIVRTAALADFLPLLENRPPVTIANLPRGTVAVHQDLSTNPERMAFVIEMRPQIRMLHDKPGQHANVTDYRVALPYTFFYFTMSRPSGNDTWDMTDQRAYHGRHGYAGLETDVIPAFLPNVYSDGRICFGNAGNNPTQPLNERIDDIVNGFYLSNFDSSHHIRERPYPFGGTSFRKWVRKTEADPNSWQTFPEWDRATPEGARHDHFTVQQIIAARFPDRTMPIEVGDVIPPLNFVPTFGRAEEWAQPLTPTQRFRLLRALENMVADDPNAITQPDPEIIVDEDEDEDDD